MKVIARRLKWLLSGTQLPKIDRSVQIHPMARFSGDMSAITIGRGVQIGEHTHIHCDRRAKIVIGDNTYIAPHVVINAGRKGGTISIGENSTVQSFCCIYGLGDCTIGDHVAIAAHCVFIPGNKNFKDLSAPINTQGSRTDGIVVEDNVWFGAGCIVLDGCHIGSGSVVGAGSVVNRSIPAQTVAVGNPARPIKSRFDTTAPPAVS